MVSYLSQASHIEKASGCPGEILFDSTGCVICKSVCLDIPADKPESIDFTVLYEDANTIHCSHNIVHKGQVVNKYLGDIINEHSSNTAQVHWVDPLECTKEVYNNRTK